MIQKETIWKAVNNKNTKCRRDRLFGSSGHGIPPLSPPSHVAASHGVAVACIFERLRAGNYLHSPFAGVQSVVEVVG
jgi:hypothetical protein